MPTSESVPVLVADDHDNEAFFPSIQDAVVGIRDWFNDVLEAACQGLSEDGIDETFPGLQARLHDAVTSVPVPPLDLDHLVRYANQVAEKALGVCLSDNEREALGGPIQFSVRAASRLEVPEFAALEELAKNR